MASDLAARAKGLDHFSLGALWKQLAAIDFTASNELECAAIFMHGRKDLSTSAAVLSHWYDRLRAPSKKLVWCEDSAHMITEEQPGRVLLTLATDVRSHVSG